MPALFPLLALALGAFAIGVTEFMPMGLLPSIASGLRVSMPGAGLMVGVYADEVSSGDAVSFLLIGENHG